jgi:hypothetical protein
MRILLFLTSILILVSNTLADIPYPQYIQFKPESTKGVLYKPDPDKFPMPKTAVILMHRDSNFLSHIATGELSKRGIVVLAMNPRCDNNEAACAPWENNALDVKQGMEYVRKIPGIESVVLFGHSGGGPTMSFYQAVAEAGVEFCQQPQKLIKCSDALANLPAADGLILWDAHPGNGVNEVRSIDPSVVNDREIITKNALPEIDPLLDLFNPDNGFNPDGESHYSKEFKERYFRAQSKRLNGLIDIALEELRQIESGNHRYPDDAVFIVPRGTASRLFVNDLSVENSSDGPMKILKNDGSIEDCCRVKSVRQPGQSSESRKTFNSGTLYLSLKSFLSVRSIRSTHAIDEIDWCSTNNSAPCAVQEISVPLLVVTMGGHYFIRDGETIFNMATMKDKDYIVIEGATHGGTPCKSCMPNKQKYDGRYDNAVNNNFDYIADWIKQRY